MACEVQVGDTLTLTLTLLQCGTTTPLDVSAQTNMDIILFGVPSTRLVEAAAFVTDGTNGQITAVVAAGLIDVSGQWKVQADVTLTGGLRYRSEVKTFEVRENI